MSRVLKIFRVGNRELRLRHYTGTDSRQVETLAGDCLLLIASNLNVYDSDNERRGRLAYIGDEWKLLKGSVTIPTGVKDGITYEGIVAAELFAARHFLEPQTLCVAESEGGHTD